MTGRYRFDWRRGLMGPLFLLALWCNAGTAAAAAAAAEARPTQAAPPVEAFFRQPDIERAELSPSGRWLAVITQAPDKHNALMVFDLRQPGGVTQAARFDDLDIGHFEWVNDNRLVFSLVDLDEGRGDRYLAPGLLSVQRDGSQLRLLVKVKSEFFSGITRIGGRDPLDADHRLLHVPAGGGDDVIVGESTYSNLGEPETVLAKRLNVVTGISTNLSRGAPPHVRRWLFDASGEPRAATTMHAGRTQVFWRKPGQEAWARLADFESLKEDWWPSFVDNEGRLWVTSVQQPQGLDVLTRFDFAAGSPEAEPMVSTPGFDFRGSLRAETKGSRALGLWVDTDAVTTVWFDARLKALQANMDKQLPGRINWLSCRRCDHPDMTVLVHSWSDRDPGQLWIYRADTQALEPVGKMRKDIDPRTMATKDFERIRARDGLTLPLWITRPAGMKPGEARPAVVLVHGGPWLRGGHWRWDAMTQFLASRGYVVIEPEFRGSTGFGLAHFKAGWRQWGQAMQDDVADALGWAVKQGHVDPRRVCIAGASYGGYSALMGLVRHPDLYRCGVAWVAATDMALLFESSWASDLSEENRRYTMPILMGDPVADAALFAANSPVTQAARIKAPVLLAVGALDQRVPIEHGKRLRAAMRAAGQEPDWVAYEHEGHGWYRPETKIDFAKRVERFLSIHLR